MYTHMCSYIHKHTHKKRRMHRFACTVASRARVRNASLASVSFHFYLDFQRVCAFAGVRACLRAYVVYIM